MPFVDGKTLRNFFIHSRGDLGGPLEGLVDEELYNILHSFRRGVWMGEELHKASFIHS
jgi:hypothetical protein